jgi:hypothetical protein
VFQCRFCYSKPDPTDQETTVVEKEFDTAWGLRWGSLEWIRKWREQGRRPGHGAFGMGEEVKNCSPVHSLLNISSFI